MKYMMTPNSSMKMSGLANNCCAGEGGVAPGAADPADAAGAAASAKRTFQCIMKKERTI